MRPKDPSLASILIPYRFSVIVLILVTIGGNALNLWVPQLVARAIDTFTNTHGLSVTTIEVFVGIAIGIFVFTYLQSIVQTIVSEQIARDLRAQLIDRISRQRFTFIQERTPATLLTNLTSDVDAVKSYVAQAIPSLISSVFLIIGASVLLVMTDRVLGCAIIAILPIIGVVFYGVLRRVRKLFRVSQEAIDWLNRVINESILGAAIIRLFNSQQIEYEKFLAANTKARDTGLMIVRYFATLIPIITFISNLGIVIILGLGGHFVIAGTMTLGSFTAFNTYLSILIFPIIIIGFMSNVIAQASASLGRIAPILTAEEVADTGTIDRIEYGDIRVEEVSLGPTEHPILRSVSCHFKPGTKNAIVGPTGAGKTQLLMVLTGLLPPRAGTAVYSGHSIESYTRRALRSYIGIVFQDSALFNTSVRENITFNDAVSEERLMCAIRTAELEEFISTLPEGLNTIVSERGTSLSGGQKQRIMLARALVHDPTVLLLDDFTARVDIQTEDRIIKNLAINYPHLTLISVTQKILPIVDHDQIVMLMEGEVIATGTHTALLSSCPEYAQLYASQQSTEHV